MVLDTSNLLDEILDVAMTPVLAFDSRDRGDICGRVSFVLTLIEANMVKTYYQPQKHEPEL